jgi:nicotinamidase-related amidase
MQALALMRENMKSAVLVLDVQTKMFTDNPRPFKTDEVAKRINDVTAQARNSGTPVFLSKLKCKAT